MTIFLLLTLMTAPAAQPSQPVVTFLNVDCADKGAVERLHTSLAVMPTITLATVGNFPDKEKLSVATTLKSLGRFPTSLGLALIRKQLSRRSITAMVVLTTQGLYMVTRHSLKGPWKIPGPREALPQTLVERLTKSNHKPPVKRPAAAEVPWWKNWVFWTGVAVITGSILAFSLLTQDPESVDVHV
ncbi:hypothetical protein KKF84_05780, partial [Myxococcota bacterium]|nr:hypothetical protein [Myxococcota bacterium]MBU1534808.1 hypothetical protein [Myxococcota bacterium]